MDNLQGPVASGAAWHRDEGLRWADLIDAVAMALDRHPLPTGRDVPGQTMLAGVADAIPASLRRRLKRQLAEEQVVADIEPLIFRNELPCFLLANGILEVAARAIAGHASELGGPAASQGPAGRAVPADRPWRERVAAVVALSALSTLGLDLAGTGSALAQARGSILEFDGAAWTAALDSLAQRTAGLYGLLLTAGGGERRQTWRGVRVEDRILAEAAAAAVVGGAASASGLPPYRWLFPFHVLCKLGTSAAEDAAATIEGWLGIEFLPPPRTRDRMASLAELVAGEASALHNGCPCKAEIDRGEVAYARRGQCRQDDHNLGLWQPGMPKPGSRNGGRYATTLWGWLRRWLGGPGAARAAGAGGAVGRPRLRPNDVAGSVLARRWLSTDRGLRGPVLRYDRILPEFCLGCGQKARPYAIATPAGHAQVRRVVCCQKPQRVYRSEFAVRGARHVLKPKLGVVIAAQGLGAGHAGYAPTTQLGPVWVCGDCGRYSLSETFCPNPDCGPVKSETHAPVPHGWVLLPLEEAWADLKATAGKGIGPVGSLAGDSISAADLEFLREKIAQALPDADHRLEIPQDVWASARQWPLTAMRRFHELAGRPGLELLLRCKELAEGPGLGRGQRLCGEGHGQPPETQ